MRLLMIPLLLLATTAAAQTAPEPAGHFFFGFGLGGVQPFGDSLMRHQPLGAGGSFSLAGHFEERAFLLGAEMTAGVFGNDDSYSSPFALSFRGGPLLGHGRFAPYLAAGFSLLAYGAVGDDAASATGLTAEVGVLMFRDLRWLRVTPYVEYYLPLAAGGGKGAEYATSLSWASAGVRVEF